MTGHVNRQLIELNVDRLHAQLVIAGITEANNHHRGLHIYVCYLQQHARLVKWTFHKQDAKLPRKNIFIADEGLRFS